MNEHLRGMLFLVWRATDPARDTERLNCTAFNEWAANEEKAVDDEMSSMWASNIIHEGMGSTNFRWTARLHLIRAANYLQNFWIGRCKDCGGKVDGSNAAVPARTLCDDCANKASPAPDALEIFERLVAAFPLNGIGSKTVSGWNDSQRREIGIFLDKIILGREVGPAPAVLKPYSRLLGLANDGNDYFPPSADVEIAHEGTMVTAKHPEPEPDDKGHHAGD